VDVIIAAAGKAAHLPGVLAAFTTLPVIGLPIKSSFMDGLDSLLSIVQMPSGVPVATVGVNAAENAAILAVQMISLKDKVLEQKLDKMKQDMAEKVIKSDEEVKIKY
jgi:5-(carboxyamino)imidazole ribonucleotide mutase